MPQSAKSCDNDFDDICRLILAVGRYAKPRLRADRSAQHASLDVPSCSPPCGWCHSDGGRAPGKGPQLMDTARSDDFIRFRIQHGKEGAMPAFGKSFVQQRGYRRHHRLYRSLKPQ